MTRTAPNQTWRALALISVALGALVSGCTTGTSAATGRTFSTPISEQQEASLGRKEHPKILEEFGGEYKEKPDLTAYVSSVGQFIASTSERTDVTYTFTVLNTPDVNAFAVPGGYVYLTRQLMGIMNDESELAFVVGHETGHIAANHAQARKSAQRNSAIWGVLGAILGAAVGNNAFGGLISQGAQQFSKMRLLSFTREQEYQADLLGIPVVILTTLVGTSLTVVAPTGEYKGTQLINLGAHRWGFKPELGVSVPKGHWDFDGYAAVWLFTDNDDFFPGGQRRTQDVVLALQGHTSYTFRPRLWLAVDATWYHGGSTRVEGGSPTGEMNNSRLGATLSMPLSTCTYSRTRPSGDRHDVNSKFSPVSRGIQ